MIPAMHAFLPTRFLVVLSQLMLAGLIGLVRGQAADPLPVASTNALASPTNSAYLATCICKTSSDPSPTSTHPCSRP